MDIDIMTVCRKCDHTEYTIQTFIINFLTHKKL